MSAHSTNKKLFDAFPLTIRELFGDTKSCSQTPECQRHDKCQKGQEEYNGYYQISEYQRHYKWGDTQLKLLLDDLKDAFENDMDYFLGAIITTDLEKDNAYKDIVDGQQRITTLMILFCVIRDVYPDINKDDKSTSAIRHKDIIDCITKETERLRFYIHPGDQTDFKEIILKKGALKEKLKKPTLKNIEKDDDPQFNFTNSALFFKDKFENWNQLGKFINFLFDKVVVVVINCNNVDSAIKLFQVINTRGLSLTHAALTKSFLLRQIKDNNNDLKMIAKHKEQFESDWNAIKTHMTNCQYDINMDELLSLYQYYCQETEPGKTLYIRLEKFFKRQFDPENNDRIDCPRTPNEAIAQIKSFSKYYSDLCDENENKEIFALRYIPWDMLWKSILLTARYIKYDHIDELQKELRKFYYIHWIAGKSLSHVKSPSFNIIRQIKKKVSIKDIFDAAYKVSKYKEKDLINKVSEKLQANNIASEKWCKPLLLLIEYATIEEYGSHSYIKLDNNIHLEHIMPKKPKDGWPHITDNVHKKYLNRAGNLTLLTGKKNSAASNKPFHEKMKIYAGEGDTKITSFNISRDILDAYRNGQKWDEAAMKNRKEWFVKEVGKVLGIEINLESDS